MDKRIILLKKQKLANLQHSPTVKQMACSVNLSAPHLEQLFRREVGASPVQYLRNLRLEKARELLENTFLRVKEICFEAGTKDQSHFVRNFKTNYGLSPSEYRKRHWARIEAEESEANESDNNTVSVIIRKRKGKKANVGKSK